MLLSFSGRISSLGAEKTRSVRRFSPVLEALEIRRLLDIKGLPILHSLPGAPTAVYLDFNGGHAHGSTYAPYDEDGDPTSFNPTEQAHITEAWRQVAVYFAMFDTDVTTEHPAVPFAWELISDSVSGGYSYVNVFPNSQPESFVASPFARTRQSALAHELGHNFGLWHQSDYDLMGNKIHEYSSGYDALHGPIMGVDYAGLVHKWFIGHFTNSASELQADVEMMAAQIHRFEGPGGDGFRQHENGGTIDTAIPMTLSGNVQSASGIIERLTDKDAYSFTSSGGTYGISAVPTLPSGLAAKLEIYGSDGSLLATSDGPNNDQELVMSLPPGTYYAIVSSHGDYGDVGAYDLTVSTLPTGWATQNIGFVGYAGSADYDVKSDSFTVAGSGRDIWGTSDDCRYVYQRLNGDGSIVARVAALDATDPWAKAGVMVRDSLAANAKSAFMLVSSANGTSFQYRSAIGGDSASSSTGGPRAPYWVELVRTGNTLTGYRSSDGVNWTQQGSINVSMSSSLYVGLAVTSHNNTVLNNAAFDNVTLTGDLGDPDPVYNDLPAPTGLTPSLGVGTGIDLSWDAVDGASGYALERSANGVNWTQIGTTAAGVTSYSDGGLAGSFRYFYRVSALDDMGSSVPSDVGYLSNRPSAPFNVTVTSWTADKLILNWRDVSGDSGYRIERSLDGVNFAPVGTVGTNVPSFTDRGLMAGTLYYYRIFALSADGDSPSSAVASGRTRGSLAPQGGQPAGVLLLALPSEENVSVLENTAMIGAEPVALSLEDNFWASPWPGIAEGLVEAGSASYCSARIGAIFSEGSEFGQVRVDRSVSLALEAHRLVDFPDRLFQVVEQPVEMP